MMPPGAYAAPQRGSAKKWTLRIAGFIVGFILVGAIVNAHNQDNNPYSKANQEAFVGGCTHSGAAEGTCRCAIRWIVANVPAEDYKAYGRLVSSGNYTASQTPAWVYTAMQGCVGASG
jgi:hypothetical protein